MWHLIVTFHLQRWYMPGVSLLLSFTYTGHEHQDLYCLMECLHTELGYGLYMVCRAAIFTQHSQCVLVNLPHSNPVKRGIFDERITWQIWSRNDRDKQGMLVVLDIQLTNMKNLKLQTHLFFTNTHQCWCLTIKVPTSSINLVLLLCWAMMHITEVIYKM